MKKKLFLILVSSIMLMEGCSVANKAPAKENATLESENLADSSDSTTKSSTPLSSDEGTTQNQSDSENGLEDYSDQIKTEIGKITSDSSSLSDELVSVNSLYDKYDELVINAPSQSSMNTICRWRSVVWKTEVQSLLERLQKKDPDHYADLYAEYKLWESYVPNMAKQMSYMYEGGSIYPTMYSYNEAMRYKQEAYTLASTLADLNREVSFSFPDSTPCGYYGDYTKDSYLIITEGMENGSYDILIHIDTTRELRGSGTIEDNSGSDDVISFTSEDDKIKGTISYFALDATFSVSESESSAVKNNDSFSFTFKH